MDGIYLIKASFFLFCISSTTFKKSSCYPSPDIFDNAKVLIFLQITTKLVNKFCCDLQKR